MNTNYVISKGVYYIMKYSSYKSILKKYIRNNYKEYILVCLLFLTGLFIGVMIINNSSNNKIIEIKTYINEFITRYKQIENIDEIGLLMQSIKKNIIFATILWLAGTTVIGMPIVLIIILLRGTVLGFTISSITITLGVFKGIAFSIASILLQNYIYIPVILTIGVSSIKLYKSIIKDKRKENIKLEVLRHTMIFLIMLILLVLSSVIENFITLKILKKIIKYF